MLKALCRRIMMIACLLLMAVLVVVPTGVAGEKSPVKVGAGEPEAVRRLQSIEDKLDEREKKLAEREKQLNILEKNVDEKLSRLLDLQREVKKSLDGLQTARDKRFKKLIKTYKAMSLSKLASLLGRMEDNEVAAILDAMKPEKVAKILPKLKQEQAVRVIKILGTPEPSGS